jgi:hypothetical protein
MDAMTAEQAIEAAKGLTFEKVWAALMETKAQMQEVTKQMKQSQEQMKQSQEQRQQSQEQMKQSQEESQKRTDRILNDLSKNIGGLSDSLGRLIETMFTTDLYSKFNELGYEFSQQCSHKKYTENREVIAEVDTILENGDYIMLVEVKTRLTTDNVDEHLERIEKVRKNMDTHGDARKIVGAVAGGVVPENVLHYAQKKGLFVIVQTGDSAAIAEIPAGFTARTW